MTLAYNFYYIICFSRVIYQQIRIPSVSDDNNKIQYNSVGYRINSVCSIGNSVERSVNSVPNKNNTVKKQDKTISFKEVLEECKKGSN